MAIRDSNPDPIPVALPVAAAVEATLRLPEQAERWFPECRTGTAQTIGARERQEDQFTILEPADPAFRLHAGVLALLADGMGGMTHGAVASHTALVVFLHAWHSKTPEEPIPQALWRCALEANAELRAIAPAIGAAEEMGTTLVAAVLHQGGLHWLAVGDSDLLLLRGGELTALTLPHVHGRELDQRAADGEIPWTEALRDPNRDALTSYIGMQGLELADRTFRPFPLLPGDVLLLASDGVTNALDERQIAELCVESAPDAQRTALRLIRMVDSRQLPGQDNATAVVLTLPAALPEPVAVPVPAPVHAGISPIEVSRHAARLETPSPGPRRLSFLARCAALLLGALLIWLGALFGPDLLRPPAPPTPGREEFPDLKRSTQPQAPASLAPAPAPSPAAPASRESAPIRGLEDAAAPVRVAPPATPATRQPPASASPSPATSRDPNRPDASARPSRKNTSQEDPR